MRPVTFIIKEGDENLTSHSGLALIGALLSRTELSTRLNAVTLPGCREPKITHGDIVKSMVGLLCLGKPDYDAIEASGGSFLSSQSGHWPMPCQSDPQAAARCGRRGV